MMILDSFLKTIEFKNNNNNNNNNDRFKSVKESQIVLFLLLLLFCADDDEDRQKTFSSCGCLSDDIYEDAQQHTVEKGL